MKTTLLIMAAGIGSRFGTGIKQLAKVDGNGHIIMDYSVHDAIEAGFNKIVFIIRKDIEEEFKAVIGDRIHSICEPLKVEVAYAFQSIDNIPDGEVVPEGRTKPWGTCHAVLAAKDLIDGPFAVINAYDYYGKQAFRAVHDWLVREHAANEYAMAGFVLKNTLSDNGGVTRGVCKIDAESGRISDIVETSHIEKTDGGVFAEGLELDADASVSMNFWGFSGNPPEFLNVLEAGFADFFRTSVPTNPLKAEYLLPVMIGNMLRSGECSVEALPTNDVWYGMTYREDVELVQKCFADMLAAGKYETELYSDL